MLSRYLFILLSLVTLAACNIREDESLPSAVSPFKIIDEAIYIDQDGLYDFGNDSLQILVEKVDYLEGFDYINQQYNLTDASEYYNISFLSNNGVWIPFIDEFPLMAIKSNPFTNLNFYGTGIHRFYNTPISDELQAYYSYYDNGYCYFYFGGSGVYNSTVGESVSDSISYRKGTSESINLSINQAQFIMPDRILPYNVQDISFIKHNNTEYIAEYEIWFDSYPYDQFHHLILNNPTNSSHPILYIPFPPELDPAELQLKQIFSDGSELIYELSDEINIYTQTRIIANCFLVLVNNPGKFIIGDNK